ncbi:MAG: c-type cytochrome domain-containing protein, partial [Pirellulaceae bacterium]
MSMIAAWLLLLFGTASFAEEAAAPVETVSYQKDVLPIFRAHCVGCHQPAKAQGGLVMTDFAKLLAGGESGEAAIVAGNIEASHLLAEIVPVDGKAEMPKNAPPLTEAQIDLIRRWIAQGAINDLVERPAPFDAQHPPVYRQAPAIPSIDFSPDGQWMAVAGYYEALVFQVADGSLKTRLVGVSPRVESVRFSPDGTRLAVAAGSAGLSGEIQVWDWQAGQLTLSQSAGFDTPFGLSWSGDGKLLAY